MAIVAMHSAATGLSALSRQLDIIANNLANVNTTGFKSSRANFEDLLYQEVAQPGVETAVGQRPSGLYVGLGTRISNTQFDFAPGSPIQTDRPLDMMIDGQGLFQVRVPSLGGSGVAYTRAGNFFTNANGQIVLGNSNGPLLEPPISVPNDTTQIDVSSDGTLNAYTATSVTPTNAGQLQLATFVNLAGLKSIGGNLLLESPASGPPITGTPGEGQFGSIVQKFLEGSNVDSVKELVDLITTQRAFEMNSQSIQAANQTLQVVANLRNG